jgi:hypothetical protein
MYMHIAAPGRVSECNNRSYYKLGDLCVSVCMSVCLYVCVCLSVSLSGYAFPHFPTYLLQIWREHSMGLDTYRGLFIVLVHATHARARAC